MSRILLVEDDTDLTQLYRDALSGAGHEVDGFIDSRRIFTFSRDPDRYDAVISDVRMEGMSGSISTKEISTKGG